MSETKDYHVADINLADWGRNEISIAEIEMPGLMATRKEYGDSQPLKGNKDISTSLYHYCLCRTLPL